jgi:hypothetical protein
MISTEAPVAKAEETGSTILHPVKQFGAQERLEILAQLQIHPSYHHAWSSPWKSWHVTVNKDVVFFQK